MNNTQDLEIHFKILDTLDTIEKSIVQLLNENATLMETNEKLRLKNSILERENHLNPKFKKKLQKMMSERKIIKNKINRIMEILKGV